MRNPHVLLKLPRMHPILSRRVSRLREPVSRQAMLFDWRLRILSFIAVQFSGNRRRVPFRFFSRFGVQFDDLHVQPIGKLRERNPL
jgi:hypothetical protein